MLSDLKEEGREHKLIICRNTLFPLKTQTPPKKKEEEEEDKLDYWIFGLGSDLR